MILMLAARTRKVKVTFCPILPDIQKSTALFVGFPGFASLPFSSDEDEYEALVE
jgi:hypothetical protein